MTPLSVTSGAAELRRQVGRHAAKLFTFGKTFGLKLGLLLVTLTLRVTNSPEYPHVVRTDLYLWCQVPKEKFERDLGEGRKLKVDPSSTKNNSSRVSAGGGGSPSDSADARAEPDVKRSGGGLPGISQALPKSSTSAPISNGPGR